jgi:hypothetical protein
MLTVFLRRLEAIEEDLREQAQGEQIAVLLELANRLKAVINDAR